MWNNQLLRWLERERQGDEYLLHSSLSVNSDAVPFNSNLILLLSTNWVTLYEGESLLYSDVLGVVAVVDHRVPNVAFSRPRCSFIVRVPLELSETNRT